MALVAPSKENVSAVEKAASLRIEEERAQRLGSECVLNYVHRKSIGKIPLDELIVINNRRGEQCS